MALKHLVQWLTVAALAAAVPLTTSPGASTTQTTGSSRPVAMAPRPTADPGQYSEASASFAKMMDATVEAPAASSASFSPVATTPPPPLVSSIFTGITSHGPYSGAPTTTGALQFGPAAPSVAPLPPNPTATYYNADGVLTVEEPAPYQPYGGLGTNGTLPRYNVNSDFDFESIAVALYQEWIELDLFNNGLATFSEQDFLDAGLTAEDRELIRFMAQQEEGHATLLTNMLGEAAPVQCTYDYPFKTVREFIDFNQRLTKWGECGVWGFINHLDAREVAQLLAQSIATEVRQQMSFKQMLGQFPYPFWFSTGIPQSWAWTYLAPYISSCPAGQTRLAWQNFPTLHIVNNPNPNRLHPNDTKDFEVTGQRIADPALSTLPEDESCLNSNTTGYSCTPAISHNRTEPLSFPGKQVFFQWEDPGTTVGPNNSYVTSTTAEEPLFVAWVNQLNLTYTDLTVTGSNTGYTFQPSGEVFAGDPIVNGTMFVALTDTNEYFTPFNLSMINPRVRALGLYQAG